MIWHLMLYFYASFVVYYQERYELLLTEYVSYLHYFFYQSFRFANLRSGGNLIYSTCSLNVSQNEDIVRHLLSNEPTAKLIPIELRDIFPSKGEIEVALLFEI